MTLGHNLSQGYLQHGEIVIKDFMAPEATDMLVKGINLLHLLTPVIPEKFHEFLDCPHGSVGTVHLIDAIGKDIQLRMARDINSVAYIV